MLRQCRRSVPSLLLLRRQPRHKLRTLTTTTTTAATTSSSSSTTTTTTTTKGGGVISRRVWYSHQKKLKPPPKESSGPKAKPEAESPWPKKMVYAGYVVGAFAVPYSIVWYLISNPNLRENYLFPFLRQKDGWEERVRRHFGEQDAERMSYTDLLRDGTVPYIIDNNDPSEMQRQQQVIIEETTLKQPVTVRLQTNVSSQKNNNQLYNNTEEAIVLRNIPASIKATANDLLEYIRNHYKDEDVVNLDTLGSSGSGSIAIDFPHKDPEETTSDNNTTKSDTTGSSSIFTLGDDTENSNNSMTTTRNKDPIMSQIYTYSTWYYQDPELTLKQVPTSAASTSNHKDTSTSSSSSTPQQQQQKKQQDFHKQHETAQRNFRIQELEYDIQQLNLELKGNSPRAIDDILEERAQKQKELKNLKWQSWKLW